jgi:ATP-dependent RNA helicase RhlB
MLKAPGMEKAIIFANRRDSTRKLSEALIRRNIPALLLSGDVAQDKRTKTLDRFKQGYVNVLVATDVAGRGIHVDGITHVFNYNLPDDPEDYVHRIGRTGRAGAEGIAISLVDEGDAFALPPLERYLGKKLDLEHYPAE